MFTPRYHCLFDISALREDVSDAEYLKALLHEITEAVEMHVLAGPLVAEGHPDNPGLTGIVVVDYSHISIHTFTKHQEALIDIFSCKQYDRDRVHRLLQERCCTEFSEIRVQQVRWGTV